MSPHRRIQELTKLLLDDLEDFLLVKLLGKTLNSGQSLTTIAFYVLISILITSTWCQTRWGSRQKMSCEAR